jgi:beta-glucuronidase
MALVQNSCGVRLAFMILLLASTGRTARAGTKIDLDGPWQFCTDPSSAGEHQGWYNRIPGSTETVNVPHTWNLGKYQDYEGTAWYFRTFTLPKELLSRHLELRFGATFYKSRIWLNGKELGGHEGGHTAYYLDMSPHAQALNFLAVEVNNQPTTQTIPGWAMRLDGWYDWWHYGGLVRDVWLTVNGPELIRRQEIHTEVHGDTAQCFDRVFVENHGSSGRNAQLLLKVTGADGGEPLATARQEITLAPGAQNVTLNVLIPQVKLWDFDHPNLYQMEADLEDAKGELLDRALDTFGARTVEIRDRHLYLNGERVRLSGMTRHEDSPWEGLAETPGTMKRDYDELQNLHVTLTRPVHYPQNPYILDYCDRHGILLVPEIPMWQFSEAQMSDPKVIAFAEQMIGEMIEQDFNHPSIFAWSVCNESATFTPGGKAYFQTLYHHVKKLDPGRYITYADDSISNGVDPQGNAASLADFVMMNEYFGSWHGPAQELAPALEKAGQDYPGKMFIISEFGYAGPFQKDAADADVQRADVMHSQIAEFARHDWIAGDIFWCYQDYLSHRNLWPGEKSGYVDMGVVDQNRIRKPSYYVWQEENAPAHLSVEWRNATGQQPTGFTATVERHRPDEIPSYALRGYRVEWQVRGEDGSALARDARNLPDLGPPQVIAGAWTLRAPTSLRLKITLYRPTGSIALEKTLEWWRPVFGGSNFEDRRREGLPVPR